MTNHELIRQINGLIELDSACVDAYARAIPDIDSPELSDRLQKLYEDHVERLKALEKEVQSLGGTPARASVRELPDEHHSAFGATLETLKALEDIRSAERSAQLAYEVAAMWNDIPERLRKAFTKYRDQEHRDLDVVDQALDTVRSAASLWGTEEDLSTVAHH